MAGLPDAWAFGVPFTSSQDAEPPAGVNRALTNCHLHSAISSNMANFRDRPLHRIALSDPGRSPFYGPRLFESGYANTSRRSLIRSTRTWASSYCACCVSQLSALPPKTLDNRTAISGEIPRFPFTSSDRVVRVTPSAAAASVLVSPRGSMHWRSTRPPGCGGFFIGMVQSLSVVIDIINGDGITVCKPEDHSPVRRTVTAQKPLNSPLSGCSRNPGKSISAALRPGIGSERRMGTDIASSPPEPSDPCPTNRQFSCAKRQPLARNSDWTGLACQIICG